MRIVFMGTPGLAVPCLEELARHHEITAVVTQPDKEGKRGHALLASPVKVWAAAHNIPVLQPERARDASFIEQMRVLEPQAIAVVAYGQILPQSLLDMAPLGCVNLHYSLLPRWRGAAPVQYALWHGDKVTGVTTQFMAARLDSGDIIEQMEVPIEPAENSGELLERLTPLGATLLASTMEMLSDGQAPRRPQDESQVTLCPRITREMAQFNWQSGAAQLSNLVRAMNPWPTAWCQFRGQPLKIWQAAPGEGAAATPGTFLGTNGQSLEIATGNGALQVQEVQAAGRPRMSGAEWARGARLQPGEELS